VATRRWRQGDEVHDTLARADGADKGYDPVQWYEDNIRAVKSILDEQMDAMAQDRRCSVRSR
jgi:hypothetical protein